MIEVVYSMTFYKSNYFYWRIMEFA